VKYFFLCLLTGIILFLANAVHNRHTIAVLPDSPSLPAIEVYESDQPNKDIIMKDIEDIPEHYIVINKENFLLSLFTKNQKVKDYRISTGKIYGDKQQKGDKRTPEGNFVIQSIEPSTYWEYDFGDGNGPTRAYGPWFIRLETGSTQTISGKSWTGIGIHGTHDESSIGSPASRGCLRMNNKDIIELVEYLKILPDFHIPVIIRQSLQDDYYSVP
jgi:hypothetical protein